MLELEEAVKYVGAAYAVFLALLVIYVAIIAVRMDRIRRELTELAELAEGRSGSRPAGASDEVAVQSAEGGQGVGAVSRSSGREAEQPRGLLSG